MRIEFNLDKKDYLTCYLYNASKSSYIIKKRKRNRIIVPIIYLVIICLYLIQHDFIMATIFSVIAILWYMFYPFLEKRRFEKHYQNVLKENNKIEKGCKATVQFENDVIHSTSDGSESKILTKEIERIVEIEPLFLIKLKTGHSFIVPKDQIREVESLKSRLAEMAYSLDVPYIEELKWAWK